jgi:hypothetical protein
MHPVLADAVFPLAEQVAAASLRDAQVSPDPTLHKWSAQQVVEHLILTMQQSKQELSKRLASGESPSRSTSWLQWFLKLQLCFFQSMPVGISTFSALRPGQLEPQDGPTMAARLLDAAEDLNKTLAECRITFGMRPCGYHPMYGAMRVEEWRVYHRVHCRHHQPQFEEAIRLVRSRAATAAKTPGDVLEDAGQVGSTS